MNSTKSTPHKPECWIWMDWNFIQAKHSPIDIARTHHHFSVHSEIQHTIGCKQVFLLLHAHRDVETEVKEIIQNSIHLMNVITQTKLHTELTTMSGLAMSTPALMSPSWSVRSSCLTHLVCPVQSTGGSQAIVDCRFSIPNTLHRAQLSHHENLHHRACSMTPSPSLWLCSSCSTVGQDQLEHNPTVCVPFWTFGFRLTCMPGHDANACSLPASSSRRVRGGTNIMHVLDPKINKGSCHTRSGLFLVFVLDFDCV